MVSRGAAPRAHSGDAARHAQDALPQSLPQVSTRPRVLIVDDSPTDRALYGRMLADADEHYLIEELDSAESALARLREEPLPGCVLLDYRLPGMTGVEFLRKLTSARGEAPVPVIMLAALFDEVLAFRAMQAGAVTILAKGSLSPRALRAAVNTAIELEAPRRQRILEAEYEYASVAYTGAADPPTQARLAQFAIALEFVRFVRVLRRAAPSWVPRSML
ncbi:MAG TPA: response regulator [Polyangiaceae bacterium]|jgi:CheY-like chemotaxis protein|nr:response regulator [Polyangiaceae bacterium]